MSRRRSSSSAAVDGVSASAGAGTRISNATATRRLRASSHRRRGPACAEIFHERVPTPVGLAPARVGRVIVEGTGKEDRDHLLAAAVPQAQAPRRGHAAAAVGAKERGARDPTYRRELRVATRVMVVDAEV